MVLIMRRVIWLYIFLLYQKKIIRCVLKYVLMYVIKSNHYEEFGRLMDAHFIKKHLYGRIDCIHLDAGLNGHNIILKMN